MKKYFGTVSIQELLDQEIDPKRSENRLLTVKLNQDGVLNALSILDTEKSTERRC